LKKTRVVLNSREKDLEKLVENNAVSAKKVFWVWTIYIKRWMQKM